MSASVGHSILSGGHLYADAKQGTCTLFVSLGNEVVGLCLPVPSYSRVIMFSYDDIPVSLCSRVMIFLCRDWPMPLLARAVIATRETSQVTESCHMRGATMYYMFDATCVHKPASASERKFLLCNVQMSDTQVTQ
jgi:hypothetical protein